MLKQLKFSCLLICLCVIIGGGVPRIAFGQITVEHAGLFPIDNSITPDSAMLVKIKPWRDSMNAQMGIVIAHAGMPFRMEKPEGALNNLIADIVLSEGTKICQKKNLPKPMAALLNYGGVRTSMPQGEIKIGTIYELYPFNNTLVLVALDSIGFIQLCQQIDAGEGHPFAGLQRNCGKAVPATVKYPFYLITSDFLASGGDKMEFLKNAETQILIDTLVRDAIIQYFNSLPESEKMNLILLPDNRSGCLK
jgi:2',3'-cyclic-nucleotide 2'-phosphodiesterase (5'-nucleotidase family)